MRIELRVLNNGSNGKPMEVFMNQESGNLFINRQRIYLDGYLNLTGPHTEDEKCSSIRITYRLKNKGEMDRSIARIKCATTSEMERFETDFSLNIVDLIFPQGSRVAVGNYNPISQYH